MGWAMPPDEFGAWGQWAGALGTVLAVVVALWVAISDARRRERDEHERQREREDQRAEQARTITTEVYAIGGDDLLQGDAGVLRVVVSNYGTLPITSVVLARVRLVDQKIKGWEEGDKLQVETAIPPQGKATFDRPYPADWTPPEEVPSWMLMGSVFFNDALGRRWLRTANEEPQPFDPSNPPADWDW